MLNPFDSASATYKCIAGGLEGELKKIAQLPDTLASVAESKSGPQALLRDHLRVALKPIIDLQKGSLAPEYRCVFVGQPRSGALPLCVFLLVGEGQLNPDLRHWRPSPHWSSEFG
jgi:hypothetical protein